MTDQDRPSRSLVIELRRRGLAGIIFDIDGVLHVSLNPVPDAGALLEYLPWHGLRVAALTNTTTSTRSTLIKQLRKIDLRIPGDEIITAPIATAEYVAKRFPGQPCYLLTKGDTAEEFDELGIPLVDVDSDEAAAVVVIGGAEDELTYARMNRIYRHLLNGASLVAMHRNISWRTADGLQLDSGPYIHALEKAAGVRATVIGKPSPAIFRQALREIGLPPSAVAMVGDDARNDLVPAKRLGMTTILVRTGKPVGPAEEALADFVIDSVADLLPNHDD